MKSEFIPLDSKPLTIFHHVNRWIYRGVYLLIFYLLNAVSWKGNIIWTSSYMETTLGKLVGFPRYLVDHLENRMLDSNLTGFLFM